MFNKLLKLLNIDLKLFDGEGGVASGSSTGEAGAAASTNNTTVGGQQSKASEKPVVVYGKQPTETTTVKPDPGTQDPKPGEKTPTQEERQASFNKLKADFKDLYDADVQGHIKNRLGKYKTLEAQLGQVSPLIEYLSEIYGTTDIPTLMTKVQGETLEQLAEKAGMPVEQYKEVLKLRQENKRFQAEKQNSEADKETEQKIGKWWEEANLLSGTKEKPGQYPDFDFREWAANEQFLNTLESLTRAGFNNPVQRAYEVCNLDNIKKTTAQKAEENTTKNIQARGNRPAENGTKNSPGIIVKSSASQLTKQDRAEIAKRASRGEKIAF